MSVDVTVKFNLPALGSTLKKSLQVSSINVAIKIKFLSNTVGIQVKIIIIFLFRDRVENTFIFFSSKVAAGPYIVLAPHLGGMFMSPLSSSSRRRLEEDTIWFVRSSSKDTEGREGVEGRGVQSSVSKKNRKRSKGMGSTTPYVLDA